MAGARGGVNCMAPGCTNFYYSKHSEDVIFHRLPTSDKTRLKKWIHVMKRKFLPDLKYARVCSAHFLDSDYVYKGTFLADGSFTMMKSSELTSTACPSQFDFGKYDPTMYDCPSQSQTQSHSQAQTSISTHSGSRPRPSSRAQRRKMWEEHQFEETSRDQVKKLLLESDMDLHRETTTAHSESEDTMPMELEDFVPNKTYSNVACQTDLVIKISVAVATDDIEAQNYLQHDHPYWKHGTGSTSTEIPTENTLSCEAATNSDFESESESSGEDEPRGQTYSECSENECQENQDDPEFEPAAAEQSSDESDDDLLPFTTTSGVSDTVMSVVYKSKICELFHLCHVPGCGKPLQERATFKERGFAVTVETNCIDGHTYTWQAHPKIGGVSAGNLLVPGALFLTGNSYTTFEETCQVLGLASLSVRQCNNIQNAYVIPEITEMWHTHLEAILSALADTPLDVSGDARCDSPGHNASYGTYTILDADSHLILAQETVHVTEVDNSYWLEPEGMQRCLNYLQDHGCCVRTLATDRHPGVAKILRTSHSHIDHEYDLWHIVKGIKKKLLSAKNQELTVWVKAIANHLWYCADTCQGDADIVKEKWISLLHHITNHHEWVAADHVIACEHAPYDTEKTKSTPWLCKRSRAFEVLRNVVLNKKLLKDLEKVTKCIQTGELESIHALYTKYVPKRKKFGSDGMQARLRLAALDHNTHVDREQARTQKGLLKYKHEYSKSAGGYIVKPIKEQKEHSFRKALVEGMTHRCSEGSSMRSLLAERRSRPGTKTLGQHAGLEKPDKQKSVAEKVERFRKK